MKSFTIQNQNGFTLIELLLYLSMSVVMVALLSSIGINVLSSLTSAKAQEELQYNAQFVTERLRTFIREAEVIIEPASGTTSTTLILSMSNPAKNPTSISLVDGKVEVRQGGEEAQILSGDSVVINTLEFHNVTYENSRGTIYYQLGIGVYNPENREALNSSTIFETTVNLKYP